MSPQSTSSRSNSSSSSSSSFAIDTTDSYSSYDSDMSTPIKTGMNYLPKYTVRPTEKILRIDLKDHVYPRVSVEDFVKVVWGLDAETVKKIMDSSNKISLPQDAINEYSSIFGSSGRKENDMHEPFCQIIKKLLLDVCLILGLDSDSTLQTGIWDKKGYSYLKLHYTDRKPDMLNVFLPVVEKMVWEIVKAVLEFKRKGTTISPPALESVPEGIEASPIHSSTAPKTGDVKSTVKPKTNSKRVKHSKTKQKTASKENPVSVTATESFAAGTSSQSSLKRSREEDNLFSPAGPKAKRAKVDNMTRDELQLAAYMLECLNTTSRHFATGVLIDKFKISMYCYERSCVIRSKTFCFTEEIGIKNLALILFAIDQASMTKSGFDPNLFEFAKADDPTIPVTEDHIKELTNPNSIAKKFCYRFPPRTGQKDYVFPVDRVIYRQRAIIGRATNVFRVRAGILNSLLSEDYYALKLSWQYKSRRPEGEIIQGLRDALPSDLHKHLPNPKFYAKYSPEELDLPHSKFQYLQPEGDIQNEYARDRDLHVTMMKEFEKLWECGSVEDFKRIFLDCVECHYHVYKTGKVLHRDISENNLMFKRESRVKFEEQDVNLETPKEPVGEVIGVLNDFDMAARVDDKGEVETSAAHHRTGTLPFMAVDLLQSDSTQHFYRHDLESYFYILIWAATHYDFEQKTRRDTPESLVGWLKDDDDKHRRKFAIFGVDNLDYILRDRIPAFAGLWDDWIVPLYNAFVEAALYRKSKVTKKESFDISTIDGLITFEKFMDALNERPRYPPPSNCRVKQESDL